MEQVRKTGRPPGSRDTYRRPRRRGSKSLRASAKARLLKKVYDLEELKNRCRADDEDFKALEQIIQGGPAARNAASRVRAIEHKWAYAYGRPAQSIDIGVKTSLAELIAKSMQVEEPRK